jgi:hypothetical protein
MLEHQKKSLFMHTKLTFKSIVTKLPDPVAWLDVLPDSPAELDSRIAQAAYGTTLVASHCRVDIKSVAAFDSKFCCRGGRPSLSKAQPPQSGYGDGFVRMASTLLDQNAAMQSRMFDFMSRGQSAARPPKALAALLEDRPMHPPAAVLGQLALPPPPTLPPQPAPPVAPLPPQPAPPVAPLPALPGPVRDFGENIHAMLDAMQERRKAAAANAKPPPAKPPPAKAAVPMPLPKAAAKPATAAAAHPPVKAVVAKVDPVPPPVAAAAKPKPAAPVKKAAASHNAKVQAAVPKTGKDLGMPRPVPTTKFVDGVLVLGCAKCRYSKTGCGQCRLESFSGGRWNPSLR